MDAELANALKIAREKVKDGSIKDFQLILDVAGENFVWVSEEAARLCGLTVPKMIWEGFFETNDISHDELREIIGEVTRSGGKYKMPITTTMGSRKVEINFKPIYVSKDRPFLVGSIVSGL